MKVLITDYTFPTLQLEVDLFSEAGIECVTAQCRTEEDVIRAAAGCAGLLVQFAPVGAKVLAARPEIRVVSRQGVGYDTIDTVAAKRYGVWVANVPDYGVGEVATHALAMVLALLRHLRAYDRDVRTGVWHHLSTGTLQRVANMTLGLFGFSRIGQQMAHISRHCFKRVIACDPYVSDKDFPGYVERVSRETLFAQSDAVSLHLALNDETRGIVNATLLGLMKPGSVLVNTSRGALIDIDALLAALNAGRLDGAALDVLPIEPPPSDHPILKHPRVLLSPHAAFYSLDAEQEMRRKAAQNLVDWMRNGRPGYVVVAGTT